MSPNYTNFAYSTLSSFITSASTSCALQTGDGALFPASDFYATIWDTAYASAAIAKRNSAAEIVLVTTRVGDNITVMTRGQDGTVALNFNVAGGIYQFELGIVAANFAALDAVFSPSYQILPCEPYGFLQSTQITKAAGVVANGDVLCTMVRVPKAITVRKMAIHLSSVGGSGGRDYGVAMYSLAGNKLFSVMFNTANPGALVGTVASYVLKDGMYYLAAMKDTTGGTITLTFRCFGNDLNMFGGMLDACYTSIPFMALAANAGSGAGGFPATLGALTKQSTVSFPLVVLSSEA